MPYTYDPITGEYIETEEETPVAAPTPAPKAPAPGPSFQERIAAIAQAQAPRQDPKADWPQVGSTGDPARDSIIQLFLRGMMERSEKLNQDPASVVDTMMDKVGPGKMLLTNMLHGAGAALLNQPFKTVRESMFERLMAQQKLNLEKQQNDSLRLQQLLQLGTREKVADTAADARRDVANTQADVKLTLGERQARLKERELELKGEQIFSDLGLDWAKFRETERHNKQVEEIGLRGVANKEAILQFEKENPKPSGGMTEAQKISATARISGMYDKSVAPAERIISMYNRISSSVQEGAKTGIMDFNLIYSYIKILDDASAVREGEVGFVERAQGIKQKLLNLPRRPDGKILADDTVKDIINQADSIVESLRESTNRERQRYLNLANKYDLETDLISDPFEDKAKNPLDPAASVGPAIMVKDPKTGLWIPKK